MLTSRENWKVLFSSRKNAIQRISSDTRFLGLVLPVKMLLNKVAVIEHL